MDGDQPLDLSKGSPSKSGTQTSAAASQARPPRPAAYTQPQVPHPHDKQYGAQPTSHMYGMERVTHRLPANTRPIAPHQLLHRHSQPQGGTPVGFAVPDRRSLGMQGVDTKAGGPPNTHPPLYSTSAMGRPGQAVEILDSRQPYHAAMPMRPARSLAASHTGAERAHSSQAPVRMSVDSRLMMGAAESSIRAMNPASHSSATLMPISAPVADPTGARIPRKGAMPSSQSPNRLVAYSSDLQRVQLSVSAQPVPANPPEFVTLRQCLVENRRLEGSEMVNSQRTSKVTSDSHSTRVAVSDQGERHQSTSATTTVYSAQPTQHYPPDVINRLNRGMPHPALVAVQRQPNFHPSMAMQHGPRLSSPPPLIHAPRSGSSSGQKDDGAKSSLSSDSDQKRKTREIPPQEYLRAAQMVPGDYPPPPPYVQHRQAHHFQGIQNSSEAAYKDRALPQYTTARQQQDYKGYAIQGVAMPPRVSTSEAGSIPVQQYFMPAAHLSPRGAMAHRQPNGDIDMRRVQGDLRPTTVAHPPPLISVAGSVTTASFTQRGGTLTVSAQGSRGIPATSVQANATGYMPQQRADNGVTLVAQIVEKQLLDDGRQSGCAVPAAWRFKHRRDPVYQQVNGIPSASKASETSKVNIPDVIVIEDDSPPSSVKTDSEPQPTNTPPTREQTTSEGFVGKRKSEPSVNPSVSKVMKGASGEKVVPAMQVQPPPAHNVPHSGSANTYLFESAVALTLQADTPKTLEKQIAQQIGIEKQSSTVSHVNSLDPTRNIFSVFTSSSSVTTQSSTQSKADYTESEQPLALTVKPSSTTTTSNYKKKRWNINALKQKSGSGAENSSQVGHTSEIKTGANAYKPPGVDSGSLSTVQLTSKLDLSSSQSSQSQLTKSPEVPLKPIKPKQQWAHSRKLKEVEALQKDAEWQAGPSERSSVRQSKSLATAIIKSVIEDEEITSGKYKSSDPKTPKLPKKPKPKLESVEKKPPKPKEPQPSTSKVKEDEFSDFDDDEDDDDLDDDLEDLRRGKISEIVPDVDDIEGMLFMSFCSKDALHAHVAVEEKTRQEMGDKGREFLMDITKFKTLNLPPKTKRKLKEIGQAELFRHKGKHGMRGIHNRIRKYERMLKLELKALKTGKTQPDIAPIETLVEQGELIPPSEEKSPGVSKVKTPGSGKKIKKATTPGNKTGTPGKIKKKKAAAQGDGKEKTPGTKSGKKAKKLITVPEKDLDDNLMPAIIVKQEIMDTSTTDEATATTELVPQQCSSGVPVTEVPKSEKTPEKFLSKKGKTTDPTKIKGYKKKKKQKALSGEDIELLENTPFEKLHWKTQERLLCCMTEEQIKERGLQAQVLRMKERKTEGFIPKKLRTKKRMKELEQSRNLEASTSGMPMAVEDGEEEQEILDDDSTDIYNFYGDGDDDDDLEKPEEIEQLAEELPSPSVVENVTKMGPELIGPAREEAGCKKSAFVSDELEKYLATEGETFSSKCSKVTFTHPLMHNKAENVAFQTPSKQGSGFVKSLDSVVQKANFIKGTGQKAKSPLQHGTQIRIVNSKMVNRKPALLSKSLKPVPKKTSNTGAKSALSKLKASLMKSHPTARRASTTTATTGDVTVVSPTQAASAASALDESFEMGQSPTDSSPNGESVSRKPKVLKTVKEPVYQLSSPRREEEFQEKPPCNNNFCRLGCVCDSIKDTAEASSEKEHCGKVDCMFGCVCSEEEKAESRRRPRRPSESSMMYFDSVEQEDSPTTTKLLEADVLGSQGGGKVKSLKGKRTPGRKKNGGQQKSKESASEQTSGKESDSAGTSTSTDGREKKRKQSAKGQNMQPKKKRMVKRKAKSESSEGIPPAHSKSSSKVARKESEDGIKEQDMSEEGFLEDRFMDEDEEDALFIDDIGLDEMDDDEREDEDGDDGMTCARTRLYRSKVCQRKCMCKQHGNSPEDERCEAEKEWSKIRAEIERRKAKEQKPGTGGSVTVMPNRKVQPYREFVYVGPRPPPPDGSPTARLPRLAPAPPPAPPPPAAPPTSAPAAAGAKSTSGGKLIEIISDCNWESAKANILQTIAQHSQRNDGPRVMRVGNFLIEIMQPNPQGKIPIPGVSGAGPPAGMRFPVPTAVAVSPQGPARILPSSTMTAAGPQSGIPTGIQVSAVPSVSVTGTAAADAPQASTTAIVGKVALVPGAATDATPDSLPTSESTLTSSKSPVLQPIPRAVTSPVQNCTVQPTQDGKEIQSPSADMSIDELQEPPSLKRQPSVSSSSSCKPSSEAEEHPLAALRSLADSPFGTASTTVTVTSSPMGSAATSQTCHSSFSTTSPKCSIIENPRCRSRNNSGEASANDASDPSGERAKAANSSSHDNLTEVSPCKDPSSLPELVPRPQTPPAPPEKRYSPSMPVLEPITPPRPMRDGGKNKLSCLEADAIAPHKPFAREPTTSSDSLKEIQDGVQRVSIIPSLQKADDSFELPTSQASEDTQEQCTEITSTSNQGEGFVEEDLENNNDLDWDTNQSMSLDNDEAEQSQSSEDAKVSKVSIVTPTEEQVTHTTVKNLPDQKLVEGSEQQDETNSLGFDSQLPTHQEGPDTAGLSQPSTSGEVGSLEDLEIDIESLEDTEGSQADFLISIGSNDYSMPINPKCTLHNLSVKKKRKSPLKEKEVKADEVQFHEGALPPEPDEDEEALQREGPMRLIHKANERRRRSEMKDLFDKMKSVLGYDEEYKMSKYAVLKETVEEIGNLLEEEHDLLVQKHQERQTFEELAEKMAKITGQEMDDIVKTYWTASSSIWLDAKELPPPVVRPKPPPPAPKLEFMPSSKPGSGSESGDRQDRPSRPSSTSSSSGSRPGTPTGSLQKGRTDALRTLRKVSANAALQVQSGKVKPFNVTTKPPQSNNTAPQAAERSKPLILKTKPNTKNNKVVTTSPGTQLVTSNIMASGQPVTIPVATVMPQLVPSVKPTVTPVIISVQSLAVSSSQSSVSAQTSSSTAPTRPMAASAPVQPVVPCVQVAPGVTQGPQLSSQPGAMVGVMQPVAQVQPNNTAVQANQAESGIPMTSLSMCQQGQPNVVSHSTVSSSLPQTLPSRQLGTVPPQQGSLAAPYKPPAVQPVSNQTTASAGNQTGLAGAKQPIMSSDMGTGLPHGPPVGVVSASQTAPQGSVSGFGSMMATSAGTLQPKSQNMQPNNPLPGQGTLNNNPAGQIVTLAGKPGQFLVTPVSGPQGALLLQPIGRLPVSHGAATSMQNAVTTTSQTPGQGFAPGQMTTSSVQLQQGQPIPHSLVPVSGGQPVQLNSPLTAAHSGIQLVALQRLPINLSQSNVSASSQPVYLQVSPTLSNIQAAGNPLQTTVTSHTMQQLSPLSPTAVRPLQLMASSVPQATVTQGNTQGITNLTPSQMHQLGSNFMRGPAPQMAPVMQTSQQGSVSQLRPVLPTLSTPNSPFQQNQSYSQSPSQQVTPAFQPDGSTPSSQVPGTPHNSTGQYLTQTAPSSVSSPGVDILSAAVCEAGLQSDFVDPQPPTATQQAASAPPSTELSTLSTVNVELLMPTDQPSDSSSSTGPGAYSDAPQPEYESI